MKSCPACDERLGPITLLLGVKYYRFACPHCGATLDRNFDRAGWIVLLGLAVALGSTVLLLAMGGRWGSLRGLVAGPVVSVALARLCCPLDITEPPVTRARNQHKGGAA
jgi:transposase